jgi:hypothetical protein
MMFGEPEFIHCIFITPGSKSLHGVPRGFIVSEAELTDV